MVNKTKMINKKKMCIGCLIILIALSISLNVFAGDWYRGDLHQHTEISSVPNGCPKETASWAGKTISQLKDDAKKVKL